MSRQKTSNWFLGAGAAIFRPALVAFLLLLAAVSLPADRPPFQASFVTVYAGRVQFSVASTFADIVGVFRDWQASLKIPSGNFARASLNLRIAAGSVSTGSGYRDRLAKGPNFFAANEYPEIRFVSTTVTREMDPSSFQMDGNLIVRGISRPVSVSIILYPAENGRQRIEGFISFDRRRFGITHNMAFNRISNIVKVKVDLGVEYESPMLARIGGRD